MAAVRLVRIVLSGRGLGETCGGMITGGNTDNISKIAMRRLKSCVERGERGVIASLEGEACVPGPIQEMCVPGSGNGGEPLKVPATLSEAVRRTVTRPVSSVCRRVFDSCDCKFETKEDYRSTVQRTLRCLGSKCR